MLFGVPGVLLLAVAPALAGVGIGVTPTFPGAVAPGQTGLPANLQITWENTFSANGNQLHADNITGITVTPTCGEFISSSTCPAASVDGTPTPHIQLSSTGTGDSGCGGVTTFTITGPDVNGAFSFSPGFQLAVNGVCNISFTVDINSVASKDADPVESGIQTAALGGASATDAVNGNPGGGNGAAEISFPQSSTTPGLGGTLGLAPVNLTDSATIVGLVPGSTATQIIPPSGTVRFSLFAPGDATCAGAPFQSEDVPLSACTIDPTSFQVGCSTSATFTVDQAGTWHWTASYIPDANNVGVQSNCADEPVVVGLAQPTINTAPDPATGTLLTTPLGDLADLEGGFNPTGSITFNLFAPGDATCATSIFTNTVSVNGGNGIYATNASFPASSVTQTGTYNWTAHYSGDANNNPADSPCTAEPVVISGPNLSIAKTPDGQTINAGDTATFTIVVTNNGAGTATNVTLSDPLPPGGGVNWTTGSAGCSVSGAPGAQTLTCSFGDLAAGASVTVVVSAVTSFTACTTMPNLATAQATNNPPVQDPGSITCQPPQLQIAKTPDGATIAAGDTATFTIVVTNLGPGTATSVTLNDPLPPGAGPGLNWTTVTAGCSVAGSPGAQTLTCSFGDLTQGDSRTVTVSAVTSPATCTTLNNTATASATNDGSVQDSGSIVCQSPQLQIAKTPDGATINAGDTATFTIVVTNLGPGTATSVTLSDPLPPGAGSGLNWTTVTAGCSVAGSPGAQTLTCSFGDLTQGDSRTVVVSAVTSSSTCTTLNNTATASATNAPSVSDPGSITCKGSKPIPTLSEWGMLLFVALLIGIGALTLSRRRGLTTG